MYYYLTFEDSISVRIFFYAKIIFKPKQLAQLHEGQVAYFKKK